MRLSISLSFACGLSLVVLAMLMLLQAVNIESYSQSTSKRKKQAVYLKLPEDPIKKVVESNKSTQKEIDSLKREKDAVNVEIVEKVTVIEKTTTIKEEVTIPRMENTGDRLEDIYAAILQLKKRPLVFAPIRFHIRPIEAVKQPVIEKDSLSLPEINPTIIISD